MDLWERKYKTTAIRAMNIYGSIFFPKIVKQQL